ncbi:MAG: VCBS repeat-containing protein [Blastocatellia bacterium]|nr:VCBS repeat-containing protein [Blastocatellia bacterium]
MKSKRKLWVIALTLACFFLGASFWSLTPSSANRGSANSSPNVASSVEPSVDQTQATARSKGRTTLHATGKYKELLFQDAADLPENVSGLSIAPKPVLLERVDLNQDGYADLVGAYIGENGGELRVRFGNRAGELGEPQAYDMKDARPEGIAFGDFNVDGHTDVAISNGEVEILSPFLIKRTALTV